MSDWMIIIGWGCALLAIIAAMAKRDADDANERTTRIGDCVEVRR